MATVILYRPDGGTSVHVEDVEIEHWSKEHIEFRKRIENSDETVTIKDYTSNLKFLIIEETTGSKSIL